MLCCLRLLIGVAVINAGKLPIYVISFMKYTSVATCRAIPLGISAALAKSFGVPGITPTAIA